jgi:hypothetical protein
VSDQNGSQRAPFVEGTEQITHGFPGVRVEIPRRFVGQQDTRPADKGSRQCNPLLLTAGKLPRPMCLPGFEADVP